MTRYLMLGCLWALLASEAAGGVVINEIFYHAPDDIRDLEWIELHNSSDKEVDLSGWTLTKGIQFKFPRGTKIAANGYLVVAKDRSLFSEFYAVEAIGGYELALSNQGETIDLVNSEGKRIDRVKYRDRGRWPVAADGYSASLERIAPTVDGSLPDNWAASPMPANERMPAGSPGARNAGYAAGLPPVIRKLAVTPQNPTPDQAMRVTAEVHSSRPLKQVDLVYTIVKSGEVSAERVVKMTAKEGGLYEGTMAGQSDGSVVRYRVRAADVGGLVRFHPAVTALRPAESVYVSKPLRPGAIPFALVINSLQHDVDAAARLFKAKQRGGRGGRAQMGMVRMLDMGLDLSAAWYELTLMDALDKPTRKSLRNLFKQRQAEAARLRTLFVQAENPANAQRELSQRIGEFQRASIEKFAAALPEEQRAKFAKSQQPPAGANPRDPQAILRTFLKIEPLWLALSLHYEIEDERLTRLRRAVVRAVEARSKLGPLVQKLFTREVGFQELQRAVGKVEDQFLGELKPLLSFRQRRFVASWRREQGSPIRPRLEAARSVPPRGSSTLVFVDPTKDQLEVFDYVHISERSAGYKIRLHKDRKLRQMSTINVIFEYKDRFVLAEPLAFELYRRVGNAACQTDFVRLSVDGRPYGYQLMFEQPNRAFLRRNNLKADGNLYKLVWYGRSFTDQHEKKTNPDGGHDDLVQLVEKLKATKGDEQWRVIEKNFNVPQVINYFAVNMCLSHWDGFFNNYYAYHDAGGKWEMYAWDQDKTWGFYDAIGPDTVFYDMPITFGMNGDKPPRGQGETSFGSWWRPGGHFSGPLLANPTFRKRFLLRTKEILETIYNEETFFPIIDGMAGQLKEEVPVRAAAVGEPPEAAQRRLEKNIKSLKSHLIQRRAFLLKQDELKTLTP